MLVVDGRLAGVVAPFQLNPALYHSMTEAALMLSDTSLSGWEMVAKHREATQGFRLRRLVLKDVPMLGELAVFETHDIGGDP